MHTQNNHASLERYSGQFYRPDLLTLSCVFLCLASFFTTTLLLLFYPFGANYGEAPLLDQALHLTAGQNIYKPSLQIPPYIIANYTPLYPLFIGWVYRIAHLPLFQIGRTISILAAISSGLLLGSMARKAFNSRGAGLLAAGLFMGNPYVGLWSGLVRVDSLALAFSLAGLWIVHFRWRSNTWLVIALVCLLASTFTRQTYLLAGPFACGVWLFHNNRKRCFTFLAIFAMLGLSIFLLTNTVTSGGFYQHIVTANVNRYLIRRTLSMGGFYMITAPFLLILAVIAARKAVMQPVEPFIAWCLLPYTVGAFITALTVGKVGSDINYFLELTSALAVWAAGLWRIKPGRPITFLLVIHTVWAVVFSGILFQVPLVKLWDRIPEVEALSRLVKAEAVKGPVLADDRLDLVVLAGQAIYYQPFEYTQLYTAGKWDTTTFEEDIASGKFPLILIHPTYQHERWPAPVYDTIQQNFTCKLQTGILVCLP